MGGSPHTEDDTASRESVEGTHVVIATGPDPTIILAAPDAQPAPRPVGPTVDPTHEVRLAVVMYGGVSLAIYMNGVAQELLGLVRSTAPGRAGTPALAYDDLSGAQRVYRSMACFLAGDVSSPLEDAGHVDPIKARFVVDIVTGSSAGGINGIFLAKALANDQDIETLKHLWVQEGDLALLLNDRRSTEGLGGLGVTDPPRSLLNSQRMYWQLLTAFHGMDSGPSKGSGLHHANELDLFVTATDLDGIELPIRVANAVGHERRHRSVFHFQYRDDGSANDFIKEKNPFLAFAARCTSAFPFAFEPMTLDGIRDVLVRFPDYAEPRYSKAETWGDFFPDYTTRGENFSGRAFGDGGSLDNKPFSYAIDQLLHRDAPVSVDRKLIYVEPDPGPAEVDGAAPSKPDVVQSVLLQGVLLPRQETIREDIRRVLDHNRLAERVGRLLIDLDLDWEMVPDRVPPPSEDEAANLETGHMVRLLGPAYGGYQRLRVAETTDAIAGFLARAAGWQEDSDEELAVGLLVRSWRDARYYHYAEDFPQGTGGRASFTVFLRDFDLLLPLREISFLERKLGELYRPDQRTKDLLPRIDVVYPTAGDEAWTQEVIAVRKAVAAAGRGLRTLQAGLSIKGEGNPLRDLVAGGAIRERLGGGRLSQLLEGRTDADRRAAADTLIDALQQPFEDLARRLRQDVSEAKRSAYAALNAEVAGVGDQPSEDDAGAAVRRALLHFHQFFLNYDMLAHPVLYGAALGEADVVEVVRISPRDTKSLATKADGTPRRRVMGAGYHHFGAFLERQWRENDILWGRLDGAECLIDAMIGRDHPDRDAVVRRAHRAIVLEELRPQEREEVSALLWKAVVLQPDGTDREAALRSLAGAVEGEPVNPRLEAILAACLSDDGLFDYFVKEYEVDPRPAPAPLLRSASRAMHVTGEVLKGVSRERKVTFLDRPMSWLARFGRLLTGMTEAATPTGIGHILYRHWLVLLYLIETFLLVGGLLLGEPVVQRFAVFALMVTLLVNGGVLMLGDVMRGRSRWRAFLRLAIGAVVIAILVLAALETKHAARDFRYPTGIPWVGGLAAHPWRSVFPLVAVAFGLLLILTLHGLLFLRTKEAPGGIVDFELAGTRARAMQIVDSWTRKEGLPARGSPGWRPPRQPKLDLIVDFLFIAAYSAGLFAACLWAAVVLKPAWVGLASFGIVIAYAQILAGALDVLEDVTLLKVLKQPAVEDSLPELARWAAQAKFALVGVGIGYFGAGLAKHLYDARGWDWHLVLTIGLVALIEAAIVRLVARAVTPVTTSR